MNKAPNIAIVNAAGDLDVTTVGVLRERLDSLLTGDCLRIIINMENVGYMDSSAMAMLLVAARRMRSYGGLLSLSNVCAEVYRALCIACLVDYIPCSRLTQQQSIPCLPKSATPRRRVSLRACRDSMCEVRNGIRHELNHTALSGDQAFDMLLACGEAIGNAVDHAKANCVSITLETYVDRVVVVVRDNGCGFETAQDEVPQSETGSELRGHGITLMRMLTDFVSISRRKDRPGTEVTLIKLTHPE